MSTVAAPSCAAPAVTRKAAEPAPRTQMSPSIPSLIRPSRSFRDPRSWLRPVELLVGDGDQREQGKGGERSEHARLEDDAEVWALAALDHGAEAAAEAGIDDGARNDADEGGEDEGGQAHAEKGGH